MIRQGLFGQELHDDFLCSFLKKQGVTAEELEEWERQAQSDYGLQDQSGIAQALTRDAFTHAHFHMRGLPQIAWTGRGTRPGDPIGDICFNIITQKVMSEVRSRVVSWGCTDLLSQPLSEALSSGQPVFLDVAFFDDVAFGIVHQSHETVMMAAAVILSTLCDSARARGLKVNFKQDKTEIMPVLKGQGVRQAKQKLWVKREFCPL